MQASALGFLDGLTETGDTCIYCRNVMACLDGRIFIGISKEFNSYVLLTSHGDWNGGIKF
jgi:hypothetical protein